MHSFSPTVPAVVRGLLIAFIAALAACGDPPAKSPPAAKVTNAVPESQLSSVTLSMDAVRRLGIETARVESTTIAPTRTVGGEVIIPPGQSLTVSAPVAGIVLAPNNAPFPNSGNRVSAGQPLMRLIPLPGDRDLLRTQQDLATAEARLKQAEAEAERTAKLLADRLVSARDNERAQAELSAARAAYDAAAAQQRLVRGGAGTNAAGLTPLTLTAPDAGVVRALHAGAGQSVAAGAPLVEIVRLDRLWIRVPLYAGDASLIAGQGEALVHRLGGAASSAVVRAQPVAAPPSADPAAASVDVYYQIPGSALRPGERVEVTLPLVTTGGRGLAVPATALVRDMSGGTWVYERIDSVTFTRRRVEVTRIVGRTALISSGPKAGSLVVTAGAAELFGTEFGTGK